jgi:hypothetical protein
MRVEVFATSEPAQSRDQAMRPDDIQLQAVEGQASKSAIVETGIISADRLRELAWSTFQREYPQLVKDHFGQWVAYRGEYRLGFGKTKTALYQECGNRGIRREEILVCCVEPAGDELYLGPIPME